MPQCQSHHSAQRHCFQDLLTTFLHRCVLWLIDIGLKDQDGNLQWLIQHVACRNMLKMIDLESAQGDQYPKDVLHQELCHHNWSRDPAPETPWMASALQLVNTSRIIPKLWLWTMGWPTISTIDYPPKRRDYLQSVGRILVCFRRWRHMGSSFSLLGGSTAICESIPHVWQKVWAMGRRLRWLHLSWRLPSCDPLCRFAWLSSRLSRIKVQKPT